MFLRLRAVAPLSVLALLLGTASGRGDTERFDSKLAFVVLGPEGEELGRTPTSDGEGVRLPASGPWHVRPAKALAEGDLEPIVAEVAARGLARLELIFEPSLAPTDVAPLARAKGLEWLALVNANHAFAPLASLERLATLRISGTSVDREDAAAIAAIPALASLSVQAVRDDRALGALAAAHGLRTLIVERSIGIHDRGVERLAALESLKELALRFCPGVTGARLAKLSKLPLEKLEIFYCGDEAAKPDDAVVALLPAFPGLTMVSLAGAAVTDEGVAPLASLANLRALSLENVKELTGEGLRHLARLEHLETLELGSCDKLTDAGLEAVSALGHLRALDLHGCPLVDDAGLAPLARLSKLESLRLGGANVTDAGMESIKKLAPSLVLLDLHATKIKSSALASLVAMKRLRTLDVSDCELVTDIAIAHLSKLTWLEALAVQGSSMSPDGVERLRKALPGCAIRSR